MRCVRFTLGLAAMLVMVAASEAQPFLQPAAQPTPLAVVMLNSIDDPAVIADLKLKDEQVKVLVARQKEVWDEAYITSRPKFAEGNAARTEATDALLKKTLTAEQYKRATQLGAQSVLRTPNFGKVDPDAAPTFRLTSVTRPVLTRYPELATVFKLTEEQKKQLTGPVDTTIPPSQRTITMSKEQADAAKEFLGTVLKPWSVKPDPHLAMRPTQPANFDLLSAKDVRAELKLTDTDAKVLKELAEKWEKLDNDRFSDLSPKEADEQAAALKAESEKALATLKPEQLARLKQIGVQTGGFGGGGFGGRTARSHIEQLYTDMIVAKEVAITEEQVKDFIAVREAFEKDAAAVLETADAFAAAEKKLNDLVAARQKKAEAVLTAAQTAKLKTLVGEPFIGSTTSDRLLGTNLNPQLLETVRAATFGKYSTELNLLALNKSIQEELKLTEEQIRTAAEKYRDVLAIRVTTPLGGGDPEAYAKGLAERSKLTEGTLTKLLSEEQAKRFRQLMLQSRERATPQGGFVSPLTINSAVAYPGVAEAVKFDDDQKKKLIAGTAPSEVLSDAQKSAIKEMLGKKFDGDFVIRKGSFGTPFPQASTLVRLFVGNNKAAEEALKFTGDQSKALAAALEAYQKAMREIQGGGPGGLSPAVRAEKQKAAFDAFEKAVMDLITADQKPRLAQLLVQVDAAMSLVATLTAPEMVKKLDLTKDQTEKLTALGEEATRLQSLRTQHTSFAAGQKLGLQMRDAADIRMVAVLTDGQKKKWKELTGELLPDLAKTIPGGFGGFGGPGGPPGFPGGGFGGPGGFPGGAGGFGNPFGP